MTAKKILWGGLILSSVLILSACNKYGGTSTGQNQTASPASGAVQTSNVITYTDAGFSPNQITVKVGDKVEFKNASSSTVQVNSAPHPTHELFPELNIGAIATGESKLVTFTTAGIKRYHNHLNASQAGQITVQ